MDVVSAGGTMFQEIDMCVIMELIELAPSTPRIKVVITACTITSAGVLTRTRVSSVGLETREETREPGGDKRKKDSRARVKTSQSTTELKSVHKTREDDPVNAKDPGLGVR